MNTMPWLVCRSFIETQRKEAVQELFSFVEGKKKQEILSLPKTIADLSLGFDLVRHLLTWTHPSWFTPLLRALPEHEIPLFLLAFPDAQRSQLCSLLLCSPPQLTLSTVAKNFLQRKLIDMLLQNHPSLQPIESLPSTALQSILELDSNGLSLLADFLGLYDLSAGMRLVIDKLRIQKISSALSKNQSLFLSSLLTKQEPPLFKPIGLQNWSGATSELLALLHKRGMHRLSKALCYEHPDFITYIQWKMPTEEAAQLSSLPQKTESTKISTVLTKQILDVLAFFKQNKLKVFS